MPEKDLMLRLERYEIDQSPERIVIRLEQRKNAVVNMVIGLGIIIVAAWLLFTLPDPSSFHYVLLGVGVLWLAGAVLGYRTEGRYFLTGEGVTHSASGRSEALSISASDLSCVSLLKILRPTGRQRKKVMFRWQVSLIDRHGAEFKGVFRFLGEDTARRLASIIAEFYGTDIREQER